MVLKELLSTLSIEDLKWSCSTDWILLEKGFNERAIAENISSQRLAKIILAFYGSGILDNIRLRQLLLLQLSKARIYELANKSTEKVFDDPKINARNLANIRWSTKSPLVSVYRDELFIEGEYLPSIQIKTPMIEEISPHALLPELFKYQEEIVNKALIALINKPTRFLVQLPTGSGKTRIMMELFARIKEKEFYDGKSSTILWLAHSSELLEQAISTLKTVWGYKGANSIKILRFFGGFSLKSKELDDVFIFATLQKIGSFKNKSPRILNEMSNNLSLVVIDEAHKISAPTYKEALNDLVGQNTSVIGVTATPGRTLFDDKKNTGLASIFDNKLLQPDLGKNPIETLRKLGVLSEVEHIDIQTGLNFNLNFIESSFESDFTNKSLDKIAESIERNKIITKTIKQEIDAGNPVIVFSCSVEHSKLLCAFLAVAGIKSSFIDHTKSYGSRKKIINQFKEGTIDVIVNYGVLSTGFDAPRIKTVLITRPTTSIVLYSQMIGRGLRGEAVGGNKKCRVIDISDNFDKYGNLEEVYLIFSEFWH